MMKIEWKTFLIDAGAEFADDRVAHFGNPVREQQVTQSGLVFADLEYLGVIAVHGQDAGDFLQSQFSNDIGNLDEHSSQLNAYCTPKGRILGLTRVFRQGDTWYLRLPADSMEAVIQRLRMFVMRADVTFEDVSEGFLRIGISGEAASEALSATDVPAEADQVTHNRDLTILRVPGLRPRFEVFASSLDAARSLWDTLNVQGAPVGESAWRLLEIQAGLPNIFAATAELFVPQMTNLQLVNGVSFKKGCYPGQEIVARMQYLGTLKRRMYLGKIESDAIASPGDALFPAGGNEQAIGRIVDAQPHPDGGQSALAVLQIASAEANDVYLDSATGPAFKLQALPYAFEG
ncbi:MAG: folate-binding protein [Gammaproteobacteria bacterium]|nr:folate-binding protein [Gammaproteobacteria bacterium]